MRRRLVLCGAVIAAATILATCTNPMRATVEAVVQQYSTARYEVNFEDRSGIAEFSTIQIVFSESVEPTSLEMGGELADECAAPQWSETRFPNDTLSVEPETSWIQGGDRKLSVRVVDLQDYPAEPIDLSYGVLDGVVYVHPDGSDLFYGTADLPKASLQAAIDDAEAAYDQAEIRVAEGTYESDEPIRIAEELTILGGYSASDWGVRETDDDWAVTDDGLSSFPTELRVPSLSASVTVAIEGAPGSPRMDGLTIVGTAGTDSAALQLYDTAAIISSCRIEGAQAESSIGAALYVSNSTLSKCFIGGGSNDYSTGVFAYQSDAPAVVDCVIEGGTGEQTSAVHLVDSSMTIERNVIYGGNARVDANGITAKTGSHATIRNNRIDAGTATSTFGLWVQDSSPTIQNNIIEGGGASGVVTDSLAEGIHVYASSSAEIVNNIITVTSGQSRHAISVGDASSPPASVNNNCFHDYGSGGFWRIYLDIDRTLDYTTIAQLEEDPPFPATGNVAVDPFLDWAGEWNFTIDTPTTVTDGGLNLSALFTEDITGATRPASPDPWSMGAYEKF